MWAAIPFFVSLGLLIAFVWYRMWEERQPVKFMNAEREAADYTVLNLYRKAVMGDIPAHFRMRLVRLAHELSHLVIVFTVEILRALERPLARLSYRMRRATISSANGKEPSAFLKTLKEKPITDSESKNDSL
jgi:hypothetical protein